MTGLSFPIASDLCTRFATQIVLRRVLAENASVKVSIIPGAAAGVDEKQRQHLPKFELGSQGHDLSAEGFAEILDQVQPCSCVSSLRAHCQYAAVRMGLPSTKNRDFENLEKRFSNDILKIELSGPQHHHLSVVDVAGRFHSTSTAPRVKLDLPLNDNRSNQVSD